MVIPIGVCTPTGCEESSHPVQGAVFMGFVVPVVRAEKRARTTGYCPFTPPAWQTAKLQPAVIDRRYSESLLNLRFQNFVDTYPRFALTYRLSQATHSISYQEDTFMKFRLPVFSRREFIKTTTSAGTVASLGGALFAPNMVQTNKAPVGKKGQSYPDERRKYTDSKGGKTVWQLTNNPPGRKASYSYYNVPKVTPDERWAIYS